MTFNVIETGHLMTIRTSEVHEESYSGATHSSITARGQ